MKARGFLFAVLVALTVTLVAWNTGCASVEPYTPTGASVEGSVILDTPAGAVLVDLATGDLLAPRDSGVSLRSVRVNAEVTLPQGVVSVASSIRPAAEWAYCVRAAATLSGFTILREWGRCNPSNDAENAEK